MNRAAGAPADTRMMGIVHDALRRDLQRAETVLAAGSAPGAHQRRAICDHVSWLMRFLHAHHHGEDAGLWPLVRGREPRARALLDVIEADHVRIAPLIDDCDAAARRYGSDASDQNRAAMLAAVTRLGDALLPHLRREEDDLMPLVSVAVTGAEWRAVDQKYYVKPKSTAELGFEGHWLLDGLDAERREVVVHQVPPVVRSILLHGFARGYRRRATACWGPDRGSERLGRKPYGPAKQLRRSVPSSGRAETVVPAPIEAVWTVLSDVTRVGEWSHECRRVQWMDGASSAAPGVRFRGLNKSGPWTWARVNEVLAVEAPRMLTWRTVPTLLFPDSCEWRFNLEPTAEGTRIVQEYEVVRFAGLARLYGLVVVAHRGRSSGLVDDLRRLGEVAAAESRSPSAQPRPAS